MPSTEPEKHQSPRRKRAGMVSFRVSEAERMALDQHAEAAGLSLGDFVRSRALSAPPVRVRRRTSVDRAELAKLMAAIGQLGNNVNQIARSLNRGRDAADAVIIEAMAAVAQMRDSTLFALGITPQTDTEE